MTPGGATLLAVLAALLGVWLLLGSLALQRIGALRRESKGHEELAGTDALTGLANRRRLLGLPPQPPVPADLVPALAARRLGDEGLLPQVATPPDAVPPVTVTCRTPQDG